jgi:hypothetical protein
MASLETLILGQIMLLINGKPHTKMQQILAYPDWYSLPSYLVNFPDWAGREAITPKFTQQFE